MKYLGAITDDFDLVNKQYVDISHHFFMGAVSSATSVAASTDTKLAWSITRQNPSGSWTRGDSNRNLICPASGYYEISGSIYWAPSSNSTWVVMMKIYQGSTQVAYSRCMSTAGAPICSSVAPVILNLSAGDTISAYAWASGAGTISSGADNSRIVIRRIS